MLGDLVGWRGVGEIGCGLCRDLGMRMDGVFGGGRPIGVCVLGVAYRCRMVECRGMLMRDDRVRRDLALGMLADLVGWRGIGVIGCRFGCALGMFMDGVSGGGRPIGVCVLGVA
jgi:hypothetical protein